MPGRNVGDADDRVRAGQPPTSGRGDQPAAVADRAARPSSSASSADGAVRVTVDGAGAVTDLDLDDRVREMTGAELAEEILRVMRRAQAGRAGHPPTPVMPSPPPFPSFESRPGVPHQSSGGSSEGAA